MFPGYLRDVALQAYLGLPREMREDWEALKVAFTMRFMPPEHIRLAQSALLGRTQHPAESVASFATAIEQLVREALPGTPSEHREPTI